MPGVGLARTLRTHAARKALSRAFAGPRISLATSSACSPSSTIRSKNRFRQSTGARRPGKRPCDLFGCVRETFMSIENVHTRVSAAASKPPSPSGWRPGASRARRMIPATSVIVVDNTPETLSPPSWLKSRTPRGWPGRDARYSQRLRFDLAKDKSRRYHTMPGRFTLAGRENTNLNVGGKSGACGGSAPSASTAATPIVPADHALCGPCSRNNSILSPSDTTGSPGDARASLKASTRVSTFAG